ncbi:MAG TPA: Ku protein [Geminicoccaceae bacterium]|nr:Ku protein [Geminicoccaceae bacterium]
MATRRVVRAEPDPGGPEPDEGSGSRAPGRPWWTGQLRLALVALPVKVYPAARTGARPALHQVHAPTGKRVRYEKTVPGIGAVDRDEILMGFEHAKDSYVLLTPAELDEIRIESRQSIELVQFVGAHEIDPIFFARPYYVVPDGEAAEEGFVVLREALRRTRRIGLGQMALRGGESIVAVRPCGRGLLLETLRFPDEIRRAGPLFAGIEAAPPEPALVDLAEDLILARSGPFDAGAFKDHYAEALRALIDRKLRARGAPPLALEDQRPAAARPQPEPGDLATALQASVGRAA